MSQVRAYWWKPYRPLKSAVREAVSHGPAWTRLALQRQWPRNFGDEVSAQVLRHLLGTKVVWAPLRQAEVIGVGSLLNTYAKRRATAFVYGSGIRDPASLEMDYIDRDRIVGLRGYLSAEVLGVSPDMAIGDPGLLVSDLVAGVSPDSSPRRGVLLIPHFAIYGTKEGREQLRRVAAAGIRIAPPTLAPFEVASLIATHELVITSSLHAFIFSDALGVGCKLVRFPGAVEPDFKYRDYQSWYAAGLTDTATSIESVDLSKAALAELAVQQTERVVAIRGDVERQRAKLRAAGLKMGDMLSNC